MANGQIIFATIPRLPANWWSTPSAVWTVWARDTWYLWGANSGNYLHNDPEEVIGGGGMAGAAHGPTRGRGHPNYIGIITTSLDQTKNDQVFAELAEHLAGGDDIIVPTFHGKYALGTGLATDWFSTKTDWWKSQRYIADKIRDLGDKAKNVQMVANDFWPDCLDPACECHSHDLNANSAGVLPMASPPDLDGVIDYLDGKIAKLN